MFVKNLAFGTKEEQIEELFRNANLKGKVLSVKVVRKAADQRSMGYGFIEMETSESA